MSAFQMVKDTLAAIESVGRRARHALDNGDVEAYTRLMGDYIALENCLVTESKKLVKDEELERIANFIDSYRKKVA